MPGLTSFCVPPLLSLPYRCQNWCSVGARVERNGAKIEQCCNSQLFLLVQIYISWTGEPVQIFCYRPITPKLIHQVQLPLSRVLSLDCGFIVDASSLSTPRECYFRRCSLSLDWRCEYGTPVNSVSPVHYSLENISGFSILGIHYSLPTSA